MVIDIKKITPAKGYFLMKIEEKPDVIGGVHQAGEPETSDWGLCMKLGAPGHYAPEFKPGDLVMIEKFHGRRHTDEDGNEYLVLPQTEVICFESNK